MKVILIGYRATGKSTAGALLSKKLRIPFVDTDRLIEDAAGMPIKDIVAQEGWEKFRERETAAVASLGAQKVCVVATGGGVVTASQNRDLLKKMGVLVWLKAPLADIVERLERDAGNEQLRPQLTSENLVAETLAVLKERLPVYESIADITVDTQGQSVVRVADSIYQHLLEAGHVFEINKLKNKQKKKS
ncbi:MAG: shikimate kinase [Deltaproteobacteria bacterium HGW-Deltaproteobacteria-7]|jgi:shikimate kinase|nr:MAG: shikimate kinase [Deltaproteobacteria bacterium HGW-Deltaproteobacteria-7]PKN19988.1 MAG: shikimate kinase [Deltaproteobacteria bacterium HGW-Deltaproteobacteria-6]